MLSGVVSTVIPNGWSTSTRPGLLVLFSGSPVTRMVRSWVLALNRRAGVAYWPAFTLYRMLNMLGAG